MLSTSASGFVVARYVQMAGFLGITAVGLWLFMPETRDEPPRTAEPERQRARRSLTQ